MLANNGDPDQTPRSAASDSDMGLHYLPMSLKKDARLIWVISVLSRYQNNLDDLLYYNQCSNDCTNALIGDIRDLLHLYLNRCELHFLWMHINKTNKFCFIMHNGCVPGVDKYAKCQLKA